MFANSRHAAVLPLIAGESESHAIDSGKAATGKQDTCKMQNEEWRMVFYVTPQSCGLQSDIFYGNHKQYIGTGMCGCQPIGDQCVILGY